MTYAKASKLFVDGLEWYIVYQEDSYTDENGEVITPDPVEYDNSEYSLAGSITDNRNGTIAVKMGKPTEVEVILANAITEEELNDAYVEGVNSL
jgi:hypothetical protein